MLQNNGTPACGAVASAAVCAYVSHESPQQRPKRTCCVAGHVQGGCEHVGSLLLLGGVNLGRAGGIAVLPGSHCGCQQCAPGLSILDGDCVGATRAQRSHCFACGIGGGDGDGPG